MSDRSREPHVAGHATHFLRRLDRACDRQVELALVLYRDAELLREVLRRAAVPDGASRVAIALEPGELGPYVVVTRDGDFVTCLAEGMKTTGLYVVGFEALAHAASAVDRMRERLEEANRLGSDLSEVRRLFRVFERAGPLLAREDFLALARWEPLLASELFAAGVESGNTVNRNVMAMLAIRPGHANPAQRTVLRALHDNFYRWTHFYMLMHIGDARRRTDALSTTMADPTLDVRSAMTIEPMCFGMVPLSARALWAAGKQARALLPSMKAREVTADVVLRTMRTLGLGMIAHASAKSRAEAKKALEARIGDSATEPERAFDAAWALAPEARLLRALDEGTDVAAAKHVEEMRRHTAKLFASAKGLPHTVAGPDDIPPDVACAIMVNVPKSWVVDNGWLLQLCAALPWLARAAPEDLFLPRAWAVALRTEPTEEHYDELASNLRAVMSVPVAPRTVASKPGRNDPCSCGSGKKYKVCCARAG